MSKNSIKQAENKIEKYFFVENKIKLIKSTIEDLENQVININESIRDLKFLDTSKISIKSPSFESISSNNTPSSYIENGIIKQIEEKENLIKRINVQISDYKSQIEILQIENAQMKNIFNTLKNEYKEMLNLRYFYQKTEIEISDRLNISVSQYHRNKTKILKDIHNLMIMYKEI